MGFDYSQGVSRTFFVRAERVQICSFLLVSRPPTVTPNRVRRTRSGSEQMFEYPTHELRPRTDCSELLSKRAPKQYESAKLENGTMDVACTNAGWWRHQQKIWVVALDSLTRYNFGTPEIPFLAEIVTLG